MSELPRTSPEAQGISSGAVSSFLDAVEHKGLELHSLMLMRHGQVITEGWWSPYSADSVHLLYSLSKSFTATAVGIAVEEKLLSLDDSVLSFFPDKALDSADDHLAAMRVRHLLSMATGHVEDTLDKLRAEDWVTDFLASVPDKAPGTVFCYNNGATFMLSAILHKLTGESLLEYLRPRLLAPLGIEQTFWQENPQGIQLGFSGLHITTEAIAKFGQLYLQGGAWKGRQLVGEAWIKEATTRHIASASPGGDDAQVDWTQGYGFQFWRCRHGAYRGDGAFGQFCVVIPEQDAVFVTTSGENDMQAILDLLWAHLLPAMKPQVLAENRQAQQHLQKQLASLSYAPVAGDVRSDHYTLNGQTYHFSAESELFFPTIGDLSLEQTGDSWCLNFSGEHDYQFSAAYGRWLPGEIGLAGEEQRLLAGGLLLSSERPTRVVASAAWTDQQTLTVQLRFIESPHVLTFILNFKADAVALRMRWNVSFGELESALINGQVVTP